MLLKLMSYAPLMGSRPAAAPQLEGVASALPALGSAQPLDPPPRPSRPSGDVYLTASVSPSILPTPRGDMDKYGDFADTTPINTAPISLSTGPYQPKYGDFADAPNGLSPPPVYVSLDDIQACHMCGLLSPLLPLRLKEWVPCGLKEWAPYVWPAVPLISLPLKE